MKEFLRTCLKCRKKKPTNQFYHSKNTVHGFSYRCKPCSDYYSKKCSKCKERRPRDFFYRDRTSRDGLNYKCKVCLGILPMPTTYYEANKREMLDRAHAWQKKHYKINYMMRLSVNLRIRLHGALKVKKWHKNSHFSQYIGCSKEFFIEYLEKLFVEGMTWENYGRKKNNWSIDHIIPLSSAKNEMELYQLCHYSNLQPLWVSENSRKHNKIQNR